jgi:hypothetical protein
MPQEQFYGLKAIFDSLDGANWLWQPVSTGAHWNFTGGYEHHDPCSDHWQGVNCSVHSMLTSLALSGYNLNGTLSESIFYNITSLVSLDLSINLISGIELFNKRIEVIFYRDNFVFFKFFKHFLMPLR